MGLLWASLTVQDRQIAAAGAECLYIVAEQEAGPQYIISSPLVTVKTLGKLHNMVAPISEIFWLLFCSVGGNADLLPISMFTKWA